MIRFPTRQDSGIVGKAAFDRLDEAVDEQIPKTLVEAILAARRRPG